jgi:ABC-type transport system involved in cytochrome bd biosynthesis fused ATPase/permease subunit
LPSSSSPRRSVFEVFTPTTQARVNFVERDTVNDRLVDALRTPGKQIVMYGDSGSGKSTLLQRK